MKAWAIGTATALTIAACVGMAVSNAAAQDQKRASVVIVAQSGTPAYQAQLDKLRAAVGQGDQARVNDEVVTLLGILQERPMSTPDRTNGTSLTDEMMRIISIQDERSGNSF